MFNVAVAAKFSTQAKIKYTELQLTDLLSLGLTYAKKFTSFCQVLKDSSKRKSVPFFCVTVYSLCRRRTYSTSSGEDGEHDVDAVEVVAAAEELVEQVELGDEVDEVEQLGAGVQDDQVVAASVAADQLTQNATWPPHRHTLLTRVET